MNDLYFWIVTAIVAAVAAGTISKLWTDRARLWRDELQDEDRLFAWRIVLFLIYPVFVGIDLRATVAAAQVCGGSIKNWTYSLFSYVAVPQGVPDDHLLAVLFAGVIVQMLLALSLLPALFFRPHPFLATLVGYVIAAIFGINLIADPVLSLAGVGGSRWQLFISALATEQKMAVAGAYVTLALVFLCLITREKTRLWFAEVSRPVAAEKLRDALMQESIAPGNVLNVSRLAVMYERVGLTRQAHRKLKHLQAADSSALCTMFAYAVLKYRERKYKVAREAFLLTADNIQTDHLLKASLLAASACAAFAQGDMEGALNLSERALEFDDAGLMARMVKVDVFLRTGRKEQAGDEIIAAIRRGLDMDLESKIPLDVDRAFLRIQRLQQEAERKKEAALR